MIHIYALECWTVQKKREPLKPSGLKAPRFQSYNLALRPTSRVDNGLSRTAIRLMTIWNAESGDNLCSQPNQS